MNKKGFMLSPIVILLILLISILIYNGFLRIEALGSKGLSYESLIDKLLFNYEFDKLNYINNISNQGYLIASNSESINEFESSMISLGVTGFKYLGGRINLTMNYEYTETSNEVNLSVNGEESKILEYPLSDFLGFVFNFETMSDCLNNHCYELDDYFINCLDLYNIEVIPFIIKNSSVPIYISNNVVVQLDLMHDEFNMTKLFPYNVGLSQIPCQENLI